MLLLVLEKKESKNGKVFYSGFMGLNSVYADEYQGKLFVKLQKWPKIESNEPKQKTTINQQPIYQPPKAAFKINSDDDQFPF